MRDYGSATPTALFHEVVRYDAGDRVLSIEWPHAVNGTSHEAQVFTHDEAGRLMTYKQGAWDGSSGITGTLTAGRTFQLDELGNWRAHDEEGDPAGPDRQPVVAQDNSYTSWQEYTYDGTDQDTDPDLLTLLCLAKTNGRARTGG